MSNCFWAVGLSNKNIASSLELNASAFKSVREVD